MDRKALITILGIAGVAILAFLLIRILFPGGSAVPGAAPTATAIKPAANPIEGQDWQMVSAGNVQAVPAAQATMLLAAAG